MKSRRRSRGPRLRLLLGLVGAASVCSVVYINLTVLSAPGAQLSRLGQHDLENRTVVKDFTGNDYGRYSIVDRQSQPRMFSKFARDSILKNCKILNPKIWRECGANDPQPCTKEAFVVSVSHAYISDNRVHEDVPGTIFTDDLYFKFQDYVRAVPAGSPQTWDPRPRIEKFNCIASLLQPYPTAKGHFAHEVLPRLIYLGKKVPRTCKFLVSVDSFTRRYIQLLPASIKDRVIEWAGLGTVYFADTVYAANEAPYCTQDNPHRGGMSTYWPPLMLQRVHRTFAPFARPQEGEDILVIKRKGPREYLQHAQLIAMLRARGRNVADFTGEGSLTDHITAFHNAKVVIGPHGAGFANLVFCRKGTVVIEIGWNNTAKMEMDNMFSRVAQSMELRYSLLIAAGDYGGISGARFTKRNWLGIRRKLPPKPFKKLELDPKQVIAAWQEVEAKAT